MRPGRLRQGNTTPLRTPESRDQGNLGCLPFDKGFGYRSACVTSLISTLEQGPSDHTMKGDLNTRPCISGPSDLHRKAVQFAFVRREEPAADPSKVGRGRDDRSRHEGPKKTLSHQRPLSEIHVQIAFALDRQLASVGAHERILDEVMGVGTEVHLARFASALHA